MDPVSGAFLLKAGSAIATGVSGFAAAQGEKKNAEINSYIGRTRAIQTDAAARSGLNDELGGIRTVLGANGQPPGVGTFEVIKELRETRDRERAVEFGNRTQEAAAFSRDAKAAGGRAFGALIGGGLKAGPSLFDLYDYRKRT
jgi:hypothetical protein